MAEVDNNWSAEFTAYRLTVEVMKTEAEIIKSARTDQSAKMDQPERQYLLDTYAECLAAVQGRRQIAKTFVKAG